MDACTSNGCITNNDERLYREEVLQSGSQRNQSTAQRQPNQVADCCFYKKKEAKTHNPVCLPETPELIFIPTLASRLKLNFEW